LLDSLLQENLKKMIARERSLRMKNIKKLYLM